jgi:hypothetical protein
MNANEVLARLASQRLGREVHPNDHVNMSQSSNDTIPTTIHVGAMLLLHGELLPALEALVATLLEGAAAYELRTAATVDTAPIYAKHTLSGHSPQDYVKVHGHFLRRHAFRGITPPERAAYERDREIDFAYVLDGVGRFRVNAFHQSHGPGAVSVKLHSNQRWRRVRSPNMLPHSITGFRSSCRAPCTFSITHGLPVASSSSRTAGISLAWSPRLAAGVRCE